MEMKEPKENLEANFSTLVLSIASSAFTSLGLAPNSKGEIQIDIPIARFNIDLLLLLKSKTMGHLTTQEQKLLDQLITELKLKFIHIQGSL